MKNILLILLITVGLSSCLVTRKYEQPKVEAADAYRNTNIADSTSLAEIPMSEFFDDAQLKALLDEALTNNVDVLIALERIKAAEAYFKQGKAGYLPTLSANGNVSKVSTSEHGVTGVGVDYDMYHLGGSLSWELDMWGKIRSNKRAAQASYLQGQAGLKWLQTGLVASISSSYYKLLAIDAQVLLTEKTVVNRQESYETMQALKEAGRVNETAVLGAKAQLHTTELLLADFKNAQALLENTINLLLGRNFEPIERGVLVAQEFTENIKSGFPVQLLRNRPDVMAAEYGLMAAFEKQNVAKASFYPSLTIGASVGVESINTGDLFSPEALFTNIVGGLTQPLLNKRAIRTNYEVAKTKQEESLLTFSHTLRTATKEVSDAMLNYTNEADKYEIKAKQLEALTTAATDSEELLKSGYATYLEVLTAQNNLLSSEISMIDNQYLGYKYKIDLYRTLGGGWR